MRQEKGWRRRPDGVQAPEGEADQRAVLTVTRPWIRSSSARVWA